MTFKVPTLVQITQIAFNRSKKKEDERKKDESHFDAPKEKAQHMIEDVSLQMLIKEAKESILHLNDEQEQYAALAR